METQLFGFEADFVSSLRCVPMIVRFKLDLCGIKLSLRAWSGFGHATRAQLVNLRIDTPDEIAAYRTFICRLIEDIGETPVPIAIEPHPVWMEQTHIPAVVAQKMQELNARMNGYAQWKNLNALQRFALIKLTRGGHENNNFLPALEEFGLTMLNAV